MTDVRADSFEKSDKFESIIDNINIDDYRFKVINN